MADIGTPTAPRSRRSRKVTQILQVLLALWVGVSVWLVGFRGDGDPVPVLPDTEQQFSLDLDVIGAADHETVYAVEQRARPAYRIFAFEPSSGAVETVFTVPEDAIIYGIALSDDAETLAVAYAPDFAEPGSGIWTLDLDSLAFEQASPIVPDVYLTELEWSADGEGVFATRIDRTGEQEQLDIALVDVSDGASSVAVANGIGPLVVGGDLYYLIVDEDKARRSVGRLDADGATTELVVGDGQLDLDHLVAGSDGAAGSDGVTGSDGAVVRVAGIEAADDAAITVGDPAEAHGNHDVPSTWWDVFPNGSSSSTDIEPIIVYDATSGEGPTVYATLEGVSITNNEERLDLIASRAIRFIAG